VVLVEEKQKAKATQSRPITDLTLR